MQNRRFIDNDPSARTPFKVVVAFDNSAASASAMKTYDYVISKLGNEIQVRRKVVDLNRVNSPKRIAAAARHATDADMVIVSTREKSKMPSSMKTWMETWSSQRSASEGALVAILDGAGKKAGRAASDIKDQFEHVAQRAHMDFFSSEVAAA